MKRSEPVKASLAEQVKNHAKEKEIESTKEYDGSDTSIISTGSTLLDLAISGGRFPEGGIPAGIMTEVFGPSGCGKTVLLCELAGAIQRQQGGIMFHDPEARLNKQFARLFGLEVNDLDYSIPDTIPQVFQGIRNWKTDKSVNGIFTDSLAALSTDLEMGSEEGDKMGGRRAKEFSQELRKTCKILTKKDYYLVCSNQVRQNMGAGMFEAKYISPGGEAIAFYSSLRLRFYSPQKIKKEKTINGKKVTRVIGVESMVEIFKSTVWKPYHTAPLTILFDYGVDDIRQNLQFVKDFTKNTVYTVEENKLANSMEDSILMVEESAKLEKMLKVQTIGLWNEIEKNFASNRKKRR